MHDVLDRFPESLLACRTRAGMTQAQLAGKSGITQKTISRWERGETSPSLKHLYVLSDALDCSVWELVEPVNQHRAVKYALHLAVELSF